MWTYNYNDELYHFGVKGMKWGVRRKAKKEAIKNNPESQSVRKAKIKKAIKVGAVVAATALAAYGVYKGSNFIRNKNTQIARGRALVASNNIQNNHQEKISKALDLELSFFMKRDAKNEARADALFSKLFAKSKDVDKKASAVYDKIYSENANVGLVTAAKNVYDYYKKEHKNIIKI